MKQVTQWFVDEMPTRVGVYEVPDNIGSGEKFFRYFDGETFYFNAHSIAGAVEFYKKNYKSCGRRWRGLAQNPNKD